MNKVPKLRFPEFSGEWEEKKLKDISYSFEYGMNAAAKSFDGVNKYIRITDIDESTNKYKWDKIVSPDGELEKKYLVKEGDLLFARTGASVGKTYLYSKQDGVLYFAGFLIRAKIDMKKYEPKFIFLQTITQKYKNWVKVMSMRSGQPGINSKEYGEYSFYSPILQEQQKIGRFFSKIDKKIEKQQEKVNLLEEYKKGMMQKIFSQEIRFKDENGEEYPKWEEKKLGEVADLTSSKRIFVSDYVTTGVLFYRGKEITELKKNRKPKDVLYITNQKYNDIKNTFGVPQKGELLLTAVGTLGNSYVIRDDLQFYFKDGNLIWFKNINENVVFLDFLLSSDKGKKKVLNSAIGSTQKALTIVELKKIKYKFPNIKEQQKIANFLSKIDDKLNKEKEKLDLLKQWKKGLLQKMFV